MNDSPAIETNVTQPAQEVVESPVKETPPWEQKTNEGTAPQTQATTEDQTKLDGVTKRIGELTYQRKAAEERARMIEEQNQKLLDLLSKHQGTQQPQSESQAQQPPTLEQFDSYEKYLAAYARWEAKAVYDELRQADQALAQKQQGETRQREIVEQQHRALIAQQQALNKMTSDAERKYPDFYEKVFEQPPDVVPISSMVANAILESEQGMDVAYYLGTHPEDAQRIAKLSPTAQLREFGKLEVSLSKQQSAAPAPIKPVAGKQASSDLPNANDDMKSWIAKRNRQLGRK